MFILDYVSSWIHNRGMYSIQQTETFAKWLAGMRDSRAKAKVLIRLRRAMEGNLGDIKSLGDGVSEMRITEGAGYRLYYTLRENVLIIILAGGDKSTQQADIVKAKEIAKEV